MPRSSRSTHWLKPDETVRNDRDGLMLIFSWGKTAYDWPPFSTYILMTGSAPLRENENWFIWLIQILPGKALNWFKSRVFSKCESMTVYWRQTGGCNHTRPRMTNMWTLLYSFMHWHLFSEAEKLSGTISLISILLTIHCSYTFHPCEMISPGELLIQPTYFGAIIISN